MNRFAKPWKTLVRLPAAISALVLGACIFGSDSGGKKPPGDPLGPCVDVSPAARAESDALVAEANDLMVDNFDYWFNQASNWDEVKLRNPQLAISLYDQALGVAPGHCQALFGRAMARASLITQDPKMDAFIKKVEGADPEAPASEKVGSMRGLMKTTPDKAAPVLIRLRENLDRVDGPTIREYQDLIAGSILTRLDELITSLETVLDYSMFAVRIDVDGDSVEIDHSEVGPGLAGLKVAKAYLTVIAGYDWEVAKDGKYDWYDTLGNIEMEEYDNLRPGQRAALDHFKGLFEQNSPFSKVRSGWEPRVQGIPALLLGALNDGQKGLRYALDEARSGTGQQYDPWRAGSGETADVDTADIHIAIEFLERSKKYLTGEQTVRYNRNSMELRVNFPRLFQINGLQSIMPYFKWNPYPEWNDTVSADTSWTDFFVPGNVVREVIGPLGYGNKLSEYGRGWDWLLSVEPSFMGTSDYQVIYRRYGPDTNEFKVLASLTQDLSNPCRLTFVKAYDRAGMLPDGTGIQWVENSGTGTFTVSACRDAGGEPEWAEILPLYKGPIYFTNPAGAKTFGPEDFDGIDSLSQLKGKIYFRDPTYAGTYPGLNNDNIWSTLQSLETVESRTRRNCDEWGPCTIQLPDNPSDLDYMTYTLYWLEEVL